MKERVRGEIIVTDQGNYSYWDEWLISDRKVEVFVFTEKGEDGRVFLLAFDKRTKKPIHQKEISSLAGTFIDKVCGFNNEVKALGARR